MKKIYMKTKTQSTGTMKTAGTLVKAQNLKIAKTSLGNIFLNQNMGKGPPG